MKKQIAVLMSLVMLFSMAAAARADGRGPYDAYAVPAAKADNAVIYATSNRRHIIKESFSDRDGDDVHRNDTMQETLSLSERFGLVILYQKPNRTLYLKIVRELADRRGISMPQSELETLAEAFALKRGSRSARCAEQFIDSLAR